MANPLDQLAPPTAAGGNPLDSLAPPKVTTGNMVGDAIAGAGGSFAQHAVNVYDLIRKIPGADKSLPDSAELHKAIADATPDNTPSHVGRFLESAGEFMFPAGKVEKATQGLNLAARAAAQAGVGAGVSAAQSGGDARATATGAALGAAGPLVGAGLEAAAPSVTAAGKRVAAQVLGRTTGVGPDAITQAVEHPTPELVDAMRGNTSEGEILGNFKTALQNVKDKRSADYQAALAKLPQHLTLDPSPIWTKLDEMLGKFNIAKTAPVTTNTTVTSPVLNAAGQPITTAVQNTAPATLDFSRSTVTDPLARKQIQSVYSDLMDWGNKPGDTSAQGMDTLKRRIGNMYTEDGQSKALIAAVYDSAGNLLKRNVPGYAAMTKDYETATKFIDQLGDLSIDAKNPGTALRKLGTTMTQSSDYRRLLTEALGQFSNVDLKGQLAGGVLSKSGPHGFGTAALDTGIGLLVGAAHGYLSPATAVAMATASPRLMGELLVAMGKAAPALKTAANAAGAIAPATAQAALASPQP